MSRKIKGVLFDFDGTLVDSNRIKVDCFFKVVTTFQNSSEIMAQVLNRSEVGDRYNVFFEFLLRALPHEDNSAIHKQLVHNYTMLTERLVGAARKLDGVDAALAFLSRLSIPFAISSATPTGTLKRIVAAHEFSCEFAEIYGSPQKKVEHISQFADLLSCRPEHLLYVGDSEIDRVSARYMGCHFFGVGKDSTRFCEPPSILLSQLENFSHHFDKY